jgi:hypothetical protein
VVSVAVSGLLLLFTAYACISSTGSLATFCGNAKGRGLGLEALPAAVGVIASVVVLPLSGRRSHALRLVPASAALLTALALALLYTVAEAPPGFGPDFGD